MGPFQPIKNFNLALKTWKKIINSKPVIKSLLHLFYILKTYFSEELNQN